MSAYLEKNSQKPWFMSNVWQQMVLNPKQIQKETLLKANVGEHSSPYGLTLPLVAAGVSLILLVFAMIMCFFKKKKASVRDVTGPSIVVYPTNQTGYPQFLAKGIHFSLPPLKHSNSLGNLAGEEVDSDTGMEPLVPAAKSFTKRSNSFSCYGLGTIDPSLYTDCNVEEDDVDLPEDHIGRLWFSVRYENTTEKLLVSVLKAKNLPSRTVGTANGCDPFVRLNLVSDQRRFQQSKIKKKTCNPFFDETFVFQVPAKELLDHTLKVTVIDSGRTKRRAIIGHILLPLKNLTNESEAKIFKMDLEKEIQESVSSDSGELLISLLYNESLNRLSVTVLEGRGLKFKDPEKQDSYIKVTLNQNYRSIKIKKTGTVKGKENPNFFECFNFHLRPESTDISSLCFEAYQSVSGCGRDKLIGKFVIGSHMFARGKGNSHWAMALSKPKEAFQLWHTLAG